MDREFCWRDFVKELFSVIWMVREIVGFEEKGD